MKTCELLDRVKALYGLPSDYALAKKLGVSKQSISNYRNNHRVLDDSLAVEISELLELNPLQVIASANLERAERMHDKKLCSFWSQYAA